ncbi:hypothetical protein K435DRAFT_808052 [Dendrothele bispora CBS 962.96]|uniref:Uncharacterized protein n=1 Tax=Dendrothele bispora (strain CBS 962.96) TaxID=1314807 RepID=A0A4V4HCC6_DENBC|nr:hypothetical protein K435DRAFT_808052 [Dendrothele bispora CBS 962.96]
MLPVLALLVHSERLAAALINAAGSTPGAKPKAKHVVKILSQESFWKDIKILRDLLKPFAIATNAAQSDHCRLNTILLLLGYLYHIHNNSRINARIRSAIHSSLEKRWKKVDQDAFKAGSPFCSTSESFALAAKVFKRFYNKSPDGIFRKAFSEYLAHAGMWSDERMSLEYFSNDARERNTFVDVVSIWREKLMSENLNDVDGANGLVVLVMRIMSMVPNSANATTPSNHTTEENNVENQLQTQLSNLTLHDDGSDDDSESIEDEDAPLTPNSFPVPTFNEIAQELMDAADEVENDADDSDSDSGDDIGDEKDRLIQNLFDYPSLSDPDLQTFLFMTEFWRRGEATLRAEVELHEIFTSEIPLDTDNRSESDSDI